MSKFVPDQLDLIDYTPDWNTRCLGGWSLKISLGKTIIRSTVLFLLYILFFCCFFVLEQKPAVGSPLQGSQLHSWCVHGWGLVSFE